MALIFHLDLDSFFVSAERLRNPKLRGRCVAVGGSGPRAVISSASYEARKFGVRSAMPTAQALRLCPQLMLCSPDFELYSGLSKKVFSIVREFTPTFEAVSIDEGYLDMTGSQSLFGPPLEAAEKLRARVFKETALTVSVGIAANRLVAKVATDSCKPDGVRWVREGEEAKFLAPLAVGKLPGCGKVSEDWLRQRGIFTLGDLQKYPVEVMERHLGKFGVFLHEASWGKGSTAFNEEAKTRSSSRETTFDKDLTDPQALRKVIWEMCVDLGQSLRADGDFAKGIRVKLRYPPFETVLRSRVLDAPTQRDQVLYEAAVRLFEANWEFGRPIRLIGVGCVLGAQEARQMSLFENPRQEVRNEELDRLKDELRKKFGDKAILTGRDLS